MRSSTRRLGGVVILLLTLSGCGDAVGPLTNDPVVLVRRLRAVDSVFNDRVLQVSGVLGLEFRPPHDLARVFPDSLLGRTFEWDTLQGAYAMTARVGAPTGSVRHVLYELVTSRPAQPLREVGTTDFTALAGVPRGVRGVVTGRGEYAASGADLRVSGSFGINAIDVQAAGTLRTELGQTPLQARFAADLATVDVLIEVDVPARRLALHGQVVTRYLPDGGERQEVDFRLHSRGEALTMAGWVERTPGPSGPVYTADISIHLNGNLLATIIGVDREAKFRDAAGAVLTGELAYALNVFLFYPGALQLRAASLLQPSVNLLRGG
jgi:hypothetical protein